MKKIITIILAIFLTSLCMPAFAEEYLPEESHTQVQRVPAPAADSLSFFEWVMSRLNGHDTELAKLKKRMDKYEKQRKNHEERLNADRDYIVATASRVNKHEQRLDGIDGKINTLTENIAGLTDNIADISWQITKGCFQTIFALAIVIVIIYSVFWMVRKK